MGQSDDNAQKEKVVDLKCLSVSSKVKSNGGMRISTIFITGIASMFSLSKLTLLYVDKGAVQFGYLG